MSLLDMFKINAAAYQYAMTTLAQTIALAKHAPGDIQASQIGHMSQVIKDMLARVDEQLKPLRVPVTRATVRDALLNIDEKTQYIGCAQILLSVQGTLSRELETAKLFALDAKRADFYEPDAPLFGDIVQAKFPSIADEISSAGKCYACDLPTAFAFHTIRTMEAGFRAVARCLGIADPTTGAGRNWSNIAKSIKLAMDAKWPTSASRMSGDGKDFEFIYGAFVGMTNPYRNETMHLSAVYSATEALHIFELVRGLMQKIASRMDEKGMPLAA